ncbi:MAG TPA: rhodanese-like domain-containing protein, partial [Candidatus Binatia bacterium]|nr:rhodanese-like domain-containing protein [Candidatus Binatia bacterium]
MKENVAHAFEWMLNLASVAIIAFTTVRHLTPRSNLDKAATTIIKLGDPVPIARAHWDQSRQTLVLALSTGCGYCSASSSFYRALLKGQSLTEWQAIAVLPQSVELAKSYMQAEGYSIPQTLQMDIGSLGVFATPTLLLVDQHGRLKQQWVGRLSPAEEDDVADHLGIRNWREYANARGTLDPSDQSSSSSSLLVTTRELLSSLKGTGIANLVDVRERSQYVRRHISSAVNMPSDELEVRAPHELLPGTPIVLYCGFSAA